MLISDIIYQLELFAPPLYQEHYDNAGLLTGNETWKVTGVLCCLDCTENVVQEAIQKNCNLIVAHHPVIFKGLKKLSGNSYVERTIITAIKNNIAVYAIHTNLDNMIHGVNNIIADKLGLIKRSVLAPKNGMLCKLFTYVPENELIKVKDALFAAGAGKIALYEECSFYTPGTGTFKPITGASPYVGTIGQRESVKEVKLEVIFSQHIQSSLLRALFANHPYETVAYEVIKLENTHQQIGSGIIGYFPNPIDENTFLHLLKEKFGLKTIRHTALLNKSVEKVALCGGSGSFLIKTAIQSGADAYVTADVKYHDFFDADARLLLADIGHWESEQFTIELLAAFLQEKFPTFAILATQINTNPIKYF